jgi:hypothetical protein
VWDASRPRRGGCLGAQRGSAGRWTLDATVCQNSITRNNQRHRTQTCWIPVLECVLGEVGSCRPWCILVCTPCTLQSYCTGCYLTGLRQREQLFNPAHHPPAIMHTRSRKPDCQRQQCMQALAHPCIIIASGLCRVFLALSLGLGHRTTDTHGTRHAYYTPPHHHVATLCHTSHSNLQSSRRLIANT